MEPRAHHVAHSLLATVVSNTSQLPYDALVNAPRNHAREPDQPVLRQPHRRLQLSAYRRPRRQTESIVSKRYLLREHLVEFGHLRHLPFDSRPLPSAVLGSISDGT